MPDLSPLWLSLRVVGAAMALVVPLGMALAALLAFRRFPGKAVVETVATLPLVLPPTVVGYGLLLALGHGSGLGRWLNDRVGVSLLFTWPGASIAAAVMALPLFVRTASAALASVDRSLLDAGRVDGASVGALWFCVIVPLAARGLLAALFLATARALGEFGATLMVAGSIPGRTQTLPLALYHAVQAGDDIAARAAAVWLVAIAFALVALVGRAQGRE